MIARIPNAQATVTAPTYLDRRATSTTDTDVNDASRVNATFCRLNESNARSNQHVAARSNAGPASACKNGPVPCHLYDSRPSAIAGASMAKATYGTTITTNVASTRPAANRPTAARLPRLAMPKKIGEIAL